MSRYILVFTPNIQIQHVQGRELYAKVYVSNYLRQEFLFVSETCENEVKASIHIYIARIFSEVQFVTIVFVDQRSRTDPLPKEKDQLGCNVTKV